MWSFRKKDPNRCSISEEWCGYFIGRRECHRHNIVWDDGGDCPRKGQEPGKPFWMMSWGQPELEGRRW